MQKPSENSETNFQPLQKDDDTTTHEGRLIKDRRNQAIAAATYRGDGNEDAAAEIMFETLRKRQEARAKKEAK